MEWKYHKERILYAVPHSCNCLALREKKEPRVSDKDIKDLLDKESCKSEAKILKRYPIT